MLWIFAAADAAHQIRDKEVTMSQMKTGLVSTELLREIPLFSSLNEEVLEELAKQAKTTSFAAHHTVFWMNEFARYLYVVISGKVRIFYSNTEGQEVTLTILQRHAYFGEMALIDGGPHSASARTVDETVLLLVSRDFFVTLLKHNAQMTYLLMEVLCQRLRSNTTTLPTVVNVNDQLEAGRTPLQHFVNKLATALTSSFFLTIYVVVIVGWMGTQYFLYTRLHHQPISFLDAPPTFNILEFIITIVSFLLTILILTNQRRETEEERVRGEIEYQVNVKAQTEITKLQLELTQLAQLVNRLLEKEQPQTDAPSS